MLANKSRLLHSFGLYFFVTQYVCYFIYGRNQLGGEKAKNVEFLPFILWVFLAIYIFVALIKITFYFKKLKASHIMSWDS